MLCSSESIRHNWELTVTQLIRPCHSFYYSLLPLSEWMSETHSVMSDSLWLCGPQHSRVPCPSPTPGAYSNSCPSGRVPCSSRLQSFPASGSFPVNQFFASGGQRIGISASASVLPVKDRFPLGWTCLISFEIQKGQERKGSHLVI